MSSPPLRRKGSFLASFRYAFQGVFFVLRHERNAQVEAGFALLAILMGIGLGISTLEWAVIFTLIGLVLSLEMINTALEAVVDLTTTDYHPLAKVAKDGAAGAVLWASMISVVVGLFLFAPRLWRLLVFFLASLPS